MQRSLSSIVRSGVSLKFFHRSSVHRINNFPAMAHLKVAVEQNIRCEDVAKIAEKAAEAILAVYNSKVGNCALMSNNCISQPPISVIDLYPDVLCRMRTGM